MSPKRPASVYNAKVIAQIHQHNSERAYIAASRRIHRSLQSRLESAMRASEIHKQRTGRALRITRQGVIDNETYLEESEDEGEGETDVNCMKLLQHLDSCPSRTFSQCILSILAEDGPASRDCEAVRNFFKTYLHDARADEPSKHNVSKAEPLENRQYAYQVPRRYCSPNVSFKDTSTQSGSWSSLTPISDTRDDFPMSPGTAMLTRSCDTASCEVQNYSWSPVACQYGIPYHRPAEMMHSDAYSGMLMPQIGGTHGSWPHHPYHASGICGWSGVDASSQLYQY